MAVLWAGPGRAASYKPSVAARPLVRILLMAGLGLPAAFAAGAAPVDPLVTTTWQIRRDAEELIADLRARRIDAGSLLERAQGLLAQHGASMIARENAFAPLSEVLADELRQAGLAEQFISSYGGVADRRLAELRASGGASAAWRALANAFPGTAAARAAWAHLADQAWDRGHVGAYVAAARLAGEADDERRKPRLAAGLGLLAEPPPPRLPQSLDLEAMWRLDVEASEIKAAPIRRGQSRPQLARTFALSLPAGDLTAASDGLTLFLVDHLVGRRIGPLHPVGNTSLAARVCTPTVARDGFVALGVAQGSGTVLVAVGNDGDQRWRIEGDTYAAVSAPLVIDGVVVYAGLRVMQEDGPELRVIAHHLSDGSPAWDVFVAKLPMLLNRMFMFDESANTLAPPSLCVHQGGLLVLSNTGLLARIGGDGAIERIWTYPSAMATPEERFERRRDIGRAGSVRSDGTWAVATPADAETFALVLGPGDAQPRRYLGDGCRGDCLDVSGGAALLAGRQITLLDLASQTPRWHRTQAVVDPSGVIGEGQALVSGRDRLTLLDLGTGEVVSVRDDLGASEAGADAKAKAPVTIAVSDGLMVVGASESLTAFGNAKAFLDEQLARVKRDPKDYRPLIALGKLATAQGDAAKAYDYFLQALERGAPAEFAANAARVLRARLELDLDDRVAFATSLARFDRLAAFAPDLAAETTLWRGRRAEADGDPAAAATAYRQVVARPGLRIATGVRREDQLEVALSALARAGLARTGAAPLPGWMQATMVPAPTPAVAIAPWNHVQSRQGAFVAGDLLLGYEGGVLTALRLSDGSEAWRRKPDQRLLGVKQDAEPMADAPGVKVVVLDGTAASAAGMRSGDIITDFNANKIRDFHRDLIPAVSQCAEGAPFVITVLRDRQPVKIEGRLGGEPVEAVAANNRAALVWPVRQMRNARGQGEGMWIAAHDLASGVELWRGALPPAIPDQEAPIPLLTPDDQVITSDGADLVAIALREPAERRERWRLPGLAPWLERARLLGPGLAMLADAAHGQARLIDLANGEILFAFTCDIDAGAVLDGGDLAVRSPDGRLTCWDLGRGRMRWRSEKPMYRLLALSGDGAYALNERRQLVVLDRASGAQRKLYGDWSAIEEVVTAPGRLYAEVKRTDASRALIALAQPGGAVLWERPLPRGADVRALLATGDTLSCVLAEPTQRPSVLALDREGAIVAALPLGDDETVRPLGGGLLFSGARGAALRAPAKLTPPPPLPAATATTQPTLAATAAEVLPRLVWQDVGKAAYAVARSEGSLLVFARLPPEVEAMEVRIGDSGPQIDPFNQVLTFQRHRLVRYNGTDEGWRMGGNQKLPAENNVWLSMGRLDPPLGRQPGIAVVVRASASGVIDGPDAPWWLRQAWRPVVAADPAKP